MSIKFTMTVGGFASRVGVQPQGGGDMTNTLVQTVRVDMEQWEKGRQWAFSCYSPAKETACYPGLEDISPEEMRLEAYGATAAAARGDPDAVHQYARKVAQLAADYEGKRRALLNPTEQIKEALRRIYNKESLAGVAPLAPIQQPGGGGGGGGIFGGGGAINTSSVFQSKPSIFGGGSSSSTSSTSSVFGKPAAAATQNNPFGGGSSVFGAAPATTPSAASLFGGGSGQQQTSTFGGKTHTVTQSAHPFKSKEVCMRACSTILVF